MLTPCYKYRVTLVTGTWHKNVGYKSVYKTATLFAPNAKQASSMAKQLKNARSWSVKSIHMLNEDGSWRIDV